jgi:hypothetical protein
VEKVVGLEQHVAELRVAHAVTLALEPVPDGVAGEHLVDREVLADVTEEGVRAHRAEPGVVVHDVDVLAEQALEDRALPAEVLGDLLVREQAALGVLAAGVTDAPGGAAHEHDGPVPVPREDAQQHDRDQVAHGQRVGGGVEPVVERHRLPQVLAEGGLVGGLEVERPGLELVEDGGGVGHGGAW